MRLSSVQWRAASVLPLLLSLHLNAAVSQVVTRSSSDHVISPSMRRHTPVHGSAQLSRANTMITVGQLRKRWTATTTTSTPLRPHCTGASFLPALTNPSANPTASNTWRRLTTGLMFDQRTMARTGTREHHHLPSLVCLHPSPPTSVLPAVRATI